MEVIEGQFNSSARALMAARSVAALGCEVKLVLCRPARAGYQIYTVERAEIHLGALGHQEFVALQVKHPSVILLGAVANMVRTFAKL